MWHPASVYLCRGMALLWRWMNTTWCRISQLLTIWQICNFTLAWLMHCMCVLLMCSRWLCTLLTLGLIFSRLSASLHLRQAYGIECWYGQFHMLVESKLCCGMRLMDLLLNNVLCNEMAQNSGIATCSDWSNMLFIWALHEKIRQV